MLALEDSKCSCNFSPAHPEADDPEAPVTIFINSGGGLVRPLGPGFVLFGSLMSQQDEVD